MSERVFLEVRTEQFAKIFNKATEQEKEVLGEMHLHYEREFDRLKHQHAADPYNVAHSINLLVDDSVAQLLARHPRAREVKCKAGCAACCHLHVGITLQEAVLLVVAAENAGIEIDWQLVQRQARWTFKQWGEQKARDRRCVFLGPGALCSVYESRPVPCRKYMVLSDPKHCDTVKFPGAKVLNMLAPEAEVIGSAMRGPFEGGSMPKMLLKAREWIAAQIAAQSAQCSDGSSS